MSSQVPVVERILSANDRLAEANRARLDAAGVFAVNLMASPGAGKTSLILRTIRALKDRWRIAVVEGDLASTLDADRVAAEGVPAVQIATGGECHLDAAMVRSGLERLPLESVDLVIVENVGNLVCPAEFRLGVHRNVLIASVPEGDDKPYKYPPMYRGVDAVVLNKTDVLPAFEFNIEYFRRGVEALNPGVAFFPLSCKTGEGLDSWLNWLEEELRAYREK
ncbi:MAG: hydrogenase nickel incorporation protein HypB [Thermoflexales bacterium]|nr:hydrogenase nickel incorporation protein HypB [Thermoflexales bacterium]